MKKSDELVSSAFKVPACCVNVQEPGRHVFLSIIELPNQQTFISCSILSSLVKYSGSLILFIVSPIFSTSHFSARTVSFLYLSWCIYILWSEIWIQNEFLILLFQIHATLPRPPQFLYKSFKMVAACPWGVIVSCVTTTIPMTILILTLRHFVIC